MGEKMGQNIKIDFDKVTRYFRNLGEDMLIAYVVLLVGIVLVVTGIILM
jgi:hypothetical protein